MAVSCQLGDVDVDEMEAIESSLNLHLEFLLATEKREKELTMQYAWASRGNPLVAVAASDKEMPNVPKFKSCIQATQESCLNNFGRL